MRRATTLLSLILTLGLAAPGFTAPASKKAAAQPAQKPAAKPSSQTAAQPAAKTTDVCCE